MSFINGVGSTMQVGKESTFGTKATGTELVNFTSEGIKVSVEKGDEGSLLASKTAQSRDLLGVNVDGNVSFILRPEFAGRIFQAALGGKDTVTASTPEGYHKHSITLCGPSEDLPSLTFILDRKAAIKAYAGCTISSMSLDCAAGDYVKGSVDLKGVKEEEGTLAPGVKAYTIPSYRCTSATFNFGEKQYCITNSSIKVDNALEEAPKTYCSGLYKGQPQHGQRSVTVDFDIPYSQDIETLKDTYLVTEANGKVVLKFTSRDENDYVEITLPNVSINDVSANIGGAGIVNASISGEALSVGTTEPITVVVHDKVSKAY